jgi:hypothetical protein
LCGSVSTGRGRGSEVEQLPDLGPGVALVASCLNGGGKRVFCFGEQAGQCAQGDSVVTELVRGAQRGEGVDRVGEHGRSVGVGARRGQLAGLGEVQWLAGYDAVSSSRVSSPSKTFCRPSWPLSAASSRWRCRVGRNSMVVWKNAHDSQMDSK